MTKKPKLLDAGYVYAPYVPLMVTPAFLDFPVQEFTDVFGDRWRLSRALKPRFTPSERYVFSSMKVSR